MADNAHASTTPQMLRDAEQAGIDVDEVRVKRLKAEVEDEGDA